MREKTSQRTTSRIGIALPERSSRDLQSDEPTNTISSPRESTEVPETSVRGPAVCFANEADSFHEISGGRALHSFRFISMFCSSFRTVSGLPAESKEPR